jgi:CheY-like chemotaxis protein
VLAVDDDSGVLAAFHLILDEGYEVSEARDGDTALAMIQASEPDVVLLDILLDGMDGISVLQALRTAGSDVPVVMVSGLNRAAPACHGRPARGRGLRHEAVRRGRPAGCRPGGLAPPRDVAALRPAVHMPSLLLIGCPAGVAGALSVALAAHARVECPARAA